MTLVPREVIFTLTKQLELHQRNQKLTSLSISEMRAGRWDELRGDVSNGTIEDQEGNTNTHFGIAACNIPIGTEGFIKAYLYQKKESILK
jgi:hypothetical protein